MVLQGSAQGTGVLVPLKTPLPGGKVNVPACHRPEGVARHCHSQAVTLSNLPIQKDTYIKEQGSYGLAFVHVPKQLRILQTSITDQKAPKCKQTSRKRKQFAYRTHLGGAWANLVCKLATCIYQINFLCSP